MLVFSWLLILSLRTSLSNGNALGNVYSASASALATEMRHIAYSASVHVHGTVRQDLVYI